MNLTHATLDAHCGTAVRIVQDLNDSDTPFPYVMQRRERRGGRWIKVDAFPFLHVGLPAAAKLFVALTTGQTL